MEAKKNNPKEAKQYFDNKLAFTTGPAELKDMIDKKLGVQIVDVRQAEDYAEGHIPGALNLPKSEWESLRGLDETKQHIVYCYSAVCHLAAKAASFFASKGFSVMEMDGGMDQWREYDYPVESSAESEESTRKKSA